MIVKVIADHKKKEVHVWDKQDNRLYYSDQEKDYEFACTLVGKGEDQTSGHFMAYWMNKIVQITKKVSGYTW